jgi:hypothetical protein
MRDQDFIDRVHSVARDRMHRVTDWQSGVLALRFAGHEQFWILTSSFADSEAGIGRHQDRGTPYVIPPFQLRMVSTDQSAVPNRTTIRQSNAL